MFHSEGRARADRMRREYEMEVFLHMAAYRATHGGRSPPLNSDLWGAHSRLRENGRRISLLARLLKRRARGPWKEWNHVPKMDRYPVVKPFLSDDFTLDQVAARLQAWPMIGSSRLLDRDPAGEWFLCLIEVQAENRRKAAQIVDCIFDLAPRIQSNPEVT